MGKMSCCWRGLLVGGWVGGWVGGRVTLSSGVLPKAQVYRWNSITLPVEEKGMAWKMKKGYITDWLIG